jgi:hypothetical protein
MADAAKMRSAPLLARGEVRADERRQTTKKLPYWGGVGALPLARCFL